jgi:hypothetical protein
MEKNKTGKYLKYAIGEIVLVVIGILIALSINTWNENNKSETEASFQLSKLRDNLYSDKKQIKTAISSDSIYINNLIFCLKVLSNEIEAPQEEFLNRSQYISSIMSFDPTRATFDGLISSGKIELISNQNLLEDLFSYYNSNTYTSWDSALKDYSRNVIMPYFLGFDHIPNVTDEQEGQNFTQFDISKFSVPKKTIEDYKSNLFILNGLRKKIELFEGQKYAYEELLKVIDSLIYRIDIELGK